MAGLKKFFSFIAFLISLLLALGLAVFVFMICLRNHAILDIDLLFTTLKAVPVEYIVLASFGAGWLLGLLLALLFKIKKAFKHS